MKKSVCVSNVVVLFKLGVFIFLFGLQIGFSQTTADIELVQSQSSVKIVDPNLILNLTIRNNGSSSVSSSKIFLAVTVNESGQMTYDIIENNTPISSLGCPSTLSAGQSCNLDLQYDLDFKLTQNTWDPTKSWDIVIGVSVDASAIDDPNTANNIMTRTVTSLDEALAMAKFLEVQLLKNPVYQNAHFSLEIAKPMNVGIVIRDITGKLVTQFPETSFIPGVYTMNFDLSSLPQGIYWYQVTIDHYPVASHSFIKW